MNTYHCPFTPKDHPRTEQEIFDAVFKHLRAQGRLSLDGESCQYRSADGAACAAGCLIPDSLYDEAMEGVPWNLVFNPELKTMYGEHMDLICELQDAHDIAFVSTGDELSDWLDRAEARIAAQFDLEHS